MIFFTFCTIFSIFVYFCTFWDNFCTFCIFCTAGNPADLWPKTSQKSSFWNYHFFASYLAINQAMLKIQNSTLSPCYLGVWLTDKIPKSHIIPINCHSVSHSLCDVRLFRAYLVSWVKKGDHLQCSVTSELKNIRI